MKKTVLSVLLATSVGFLSQAQLQTPKASPLGKIEQKIGLTDIKIEYSRPGKNNRTVFGDVVPFNEIWRTGANENTKITTSDVLIFGADTLKAGTYAIFTKPAQDAWEIYFYTETTNWGTPAKWDETKVALKTKASTVTLSSALETFTISLDNLENESATLSFSWDKTSALLTFKLATGQKVLANIQKVMAGPNAGDFYAAGNYYFQNKIDNKQALVWVSKAVELQPESFWMIRTKGLIQKELGDKKGAIESFKKSLAAAEKAGNKQYVQMNTVSITELEK
jgi:tetratricopeptide (TPR) repeat protein